MSSSYDFILWDWNGTLIDDVNVALQSVNDMLVKRGMKAITLEQYYSYLDTPIIKFYEHLFDFDKVPFETIVKEFQLGYSKHIPLNPVFRDAKEMLGLVKESGGKQLVISASAQDKISKDARSYGIYDYFECISGAENMKAESKITRAKRVLSEFDAHPGKSIVVGDTLHDFYMARELGANCVLFSKGHQSKADLLSTGAPVIDRLSELQNYI